MCFISLRSKYIPGIYLTLLSRTNSVTPVYKDKLILDFALCNFLIPEDKFSLGFLTSWLLKKITLLLLPEVITLKMGMPRFPGRATDPMNTTWRYTIVSLWAKWQELENNWCSSKFSENFGKICYVLNSRIYLFDRYSDTGKPEWPDLWGLFCPLQGCKWFLIQIRHPLYLLGLVPIKIKTA